jgi:hypothetical protein
MEPLHSINKHPRCEFLYIFNYVTSPTPHAAVSEKATFPEFPFAPPIHVVVKGLSPQTALAARTQPSQRPFVISIVWPAVTALRVNLASPEAPVVVVGEPPHLGGSVSF